MTESRFCLLTKGTKRCIMLVISHHHQPHPSGGTHRCPRTSCRKHLGVGPFRLTPGVACGSFWFPGPVCGACNVCPGRKEGARQDRVTAVATFGSASQSIRDLSGSTIRCHQIVQRMGRATNRQVYESGSQRTVSQRRPFVLFRIRCCIPGSQCPKAHR